MTHEQFWRWLNNTLLQAGMNVQYHQTMSYRLWLLEWVANGVVASCIIGSIVLAGLHKSKK